MKELAQGIASLGRNNDTMLVHMTPGEVHGLQRLAMANGGSLTINPQTGLPEAGFLSSILPIVAGVASSAMGLGPLGTALLTGGTSALTSGSLTKGLLAGLGAYGLSSIGDSLASAGEKVANTASSTAATQAGQEATRAALANSALTPSIPTQVVPTPDVGSGAFGDIQAQALRDMGGAPAQSAAQTTAAQTIVPRPADFATNPYSPEGMAYMQSQGMAPQTAAQSAGDFAANASPYKPNESILGSQKLGNMYVGAQQPDALKNAVLSRNGLMAAAGLVPMAMDSFGNKSPAKAAPYTTGSSFQPRSAYDRELAALQPGNSEQRYFTGNRIYGPGNSLANYGAAKGGLASLKGFADGGGVGYPDLNFYQPQIRQDPMQQKLNYFGEPEGYADGGTAQAAPLPSPSAPAGMPLMPFPGAGTNGIPAGAMTADYSRMTGGALNGVASAYAPFRFNAANSGFFDQMPRRQSAGGAGAPAAGGYTPFSLYGPGGFKPTAAQIAPPTQAQATAAAPKPPAPAPAAAPTPISDWTTYGYMAEGGAVGYAQGGIADLTPTYAAGGKLLRGPGDGVSDSIPAVITGPKPQRAALADGEFVVPARIVSELGNGSTEAGARKLYAMMDRVQHARRKSIGKNKVAVNSRAEKLLPA